MWYISSEQKTTLALLDQMVNPHWPHLPKRKESYKNELEKEGIEGAWRTITDDPVDYHFYYHILDGDEGGRSPKLTTLMEKANKQQTFQPERQVLFTFDCKEQKQGKVTNLQIYSLAYSWY